MYLTKIVLYLRVNTSQLIFTICGGYFYKVPMNTELSAPRGNAGLGPCGSSGHISSIDQFITLSECVSLFKYT